MNICRSIILFIGIALVLIAVVVWHGNQRAPEARFSSAHPTTATPVLSKPVGMVVHTNGVEQTIAPTTTLLSKVEGKVGILSSYNDVPIYFYGIVEDQFGGVVAGVKIAFSVRVINGQESTVKRGEVVSDNNGAFTITGFRGQDLGFMPKKAGYVLAASGELFKYSHMEEHPYVPDPNNPTVIKMWKLQGAEPLVNIDLHYKHSFTNEPFFFDLVSGRVVPVGGDLKAIITRAPGFITQRKPDRLDWSIELVPIDGGVMVPEYNAAHYTFEAPANGYQDSFQAHMNHDDASWFDNIGESFFLKSRNGGVYSKFSFYFEINDDPNGLMSFQFKGVANTNGSRNWEATAPK